MLQSTRPYFTSREARKLGVPYHVLSYYAFTGKFQRIARGLYKSMERSDSVEFFWEDLIEAVYSIPKGVICLISALAIYDLTDEIPRQHWIAIPNNTTAKSSSQLKIVRFRNMKIGKTEIHIGGVKVSIFDRERCIIDAFRLLSKEIAIKALKMAFDTTKDSKIDLIKLQYYAKKLRVNIKDYILMMVTT